METHSCPLCGNLASSKGVAFSRLLCVCPLCDLHFVPAGFHLSPGQELARYLLHRNSLEDGGYVKFLMPAVAYLKTYLTKVSDGVSTVLDYGSGPVPVLVQLLNRAGFSAVGYDPFFGDQETQGCVVTSSVAGQGVFDAVVSTETVEHFKDPVADWQKMIALIRPGGFLVVGTSLIPPGQDMTSWYYASDPTHIAFYSEATFRFIAIRWQLSIVETNGRNWVVMQKGC